MVSIVGRNGAGKSTFSKLVCGFEDPNQGEIFFEGQDLLKENIRSRAKKIGYVMQNPNQMISKTMIYDEVALALQKSGKSEEEIRRKVEDTLKVCGLYPFRNWPISALSFGQKKRVTIASVLVQDPKLIILDEPTAGQDFKHYTEIMEFLRGLNEKGFSQRILKPVISPLSATSSELQKIVGYPSFFISGPANWENVSLMIITCVMARSLSKNSFAPGIGSIFAIVSWISFNPRPCSFKIPIRYFISLS